MFKFNVRQVLGIGLGFGLLLSGMNVQAGSSITATLFQDNFNRTATGVNPIGTGWAGVTPANRQGTWDINGSDAILNPWNTPNNNLGGQYVSGVNLGSLTGDHGWLIRMDLRRPSYVGSDGIGSFDIMSDWNGDSYADNPTGIRLSFSNTGGNTTLQVDLSDINSGVGTSLYSASFPNANWPNLTWKTAELERYGNYVRASLSGVFDTGWRATSMPDTGYAGFNQWFVFGNTTAYSTGFDNFNLFQTPEPSTAILLVLGGLAFWRRRAS